MTRRITHEHLHEHLLAIGKDQEAQSALLAQMKQEQDAQGLLLRRTFRKVGKIMTANENLAAAIERVEGVGPSVIKALGELAKEIANLQNNTEAQAMADRLNAQADAIAAAVEANPDPNPDD